MKLISCWCFLICHGIHSVSRMFSLVIILSGVLTVVIGQPGKCDQKPIGAVGPPSDDPNPPYHLQVKTQTGSDRTNSFLPDQTYVLVLESENTSRPFKEFMITVEDPDVDNKYHFNHKGVDVGRLTTLDDDLKSQYSSRCFSSVENKDISDKLRIQMHWVSPKNTAMTQGQRVRFRAMVAENKEVWHVGGKLSFTIERNDTPPADSPPFKPNPSCNVCSEARYQVVFKGMWSRGTHSLHYPNNPDSNMYSQMVGASHNFDFVLWQPGSGASDGLKKLATNADISKLERDIIEKMGEGTRTLIRGKKHAHPHMSDPSHALFRVDKEYHLFSLVVAMKPSPDWFLGTSRFELCTEDGWMDYREMPLYPWDAGILDGVSYESATSVTQPEDNVQRVAVGSFDKASPFYQMNLNDLKPFAMLEVKKLDEYPLDQCSNEEGEEMAEEEKEEDENEEEPNDSPLVAESRLKTTCPEASEWSECVPVHGSCGLGVQSRTLFHRTDTYYQSDDPDILQVKPLSSCREALEEQSCFIDC